MLGEPARRVTDLLGTSPEFLRTIVDSALAAVVVMDAEGLVVGWGSRAEDVFGFTSEQALGCRLAELIVPLRYRAAHEAGIRHYRETGEGPVLGKVVELSALRADGTEFPAELAISPAAHDGDRTAFIAFVRDISDRHEAARRQDELYSYAAEAMTALRDFASLAVHELRTPLSVASGYLSMLRDGTLGPPSESWNGSLAIVEEKIREASRLVDDLLVTSRLEAGALQPQLAPVDLDALVREAVKRAQPRARVAGAEVHAPAQAQSAPVLADREMTSKILDNLLNNALAHAGEGAQVEVELSSSPMPAVRVKDNGKGIPGEIRERIFERFFRADAKGLKAGTGLGLYLSRQLAELQGATLELEWSDPGRGSCFRLSFPAPPHPR